ncbi:MAG: serine hydrolase [Thermoanaerobaculia bacterium]|nr:serine hydrolase [Thermoanaerobaculia bacterium]
MHRSLRSVSSRAAVVAGIALVAAPVDAASQADPVATFDALAAQARVDWEVPGLAVAVVHGGRVRLAKGYGVRELGGSDPVDADTLFAAASTTKAMTVAALGMLVDEGKLAWDDPVRKHVPELDLDDAALADELTVRDLLVHHTGLPATDFLWFSNDLDWKGILGKMAAVERKAPTRGHFEYNNVLYGLAGDVVGRVSGRPWEEFVRSRIFEPLGMRRTTPLGREVRARGNFVTPHSREDGSLAGYDTFAAVDPIPAAGSAWTSANEMAKWISFLLAPETVKRADGAPLLAPATIDEIFRPQVVIQPGGFYPTAAKTKPHWTTYGLGWFQQDYRGRKVDFHTGSIDGLVAIVGLVRDEGFGVAVFGNLDHAELRHALMFSAFDLFLDGQLARDWSGELRAMYAELRAQGEAHWAELAAKRVPDAPPRHALAKYAGTYADPLYGALEFTVEGDGLGVRLGSIVGGHAEPWHFETFRLAFRPRFYGFGLLNFVTGTDGEVAAVEIDGTRYVRQPEAAEAAR